jgi:outer membrane protein TolC
MFFLQFVIISFIFLSQPLFAEETISLHTLIEEAQKNNLQLTALRFHQAGMEEEIAQSVILDDPTLTLTKWRIPSNFNIGQSQETWLEVAQSFPYPGKRSLKRNIATIDWEIAKQAYQEKLLEVTAEIKSAYYNLLLITKTVTLHHEHQALLTAFIKIAEKRYAVGGLTQQAILKTEVNLNKLHNSLMVAEQDKIQTEAKMNALLNRPESSPMERPKQIAYLPFSLSYQTLAEEALIHQAGLKIALLQAQKSKITKALTKKEILPDVMIGLAYMDMQNGEENPWMATGKIALPFVFWKKYDSKNRKAALEVDKAETDYQALKNETLLQIKTIFTRIKTDEQLIESIQKKLIPLATQSLAVAQIDYQSGKNDFMNFIDSEQTLLDLQMEYYTKLNDYWQQIAWLSPLIGKEIAPQ